MAACGSERPDQQGAPTTSGTSQPAPAVDGGPPGTAPAAPAGPAPGDAPGGAPPATSVDEPRPGDPARPPAAVPAPGGVGSMAGPYLRPDGPGSIVVEVRSQSGAEPRPAAIERVRAVLADVSGKPVGVVAGGIDGGGRAWTAAELRSVADRGVPQAADAAVLRLLFVHGGFAENERAVGVAVRGDVAAIFRERVAEAAGVFGDPAAVEDAVTMHEVGHLLGLVDLVLDTGRDDPEHPGHSPNRGSVMYYAVESTLLGAVLEGGPPRDFDAADRADLARIRGA